MQKSRNNRRNKEKGFPISELLPIGSENAIPGEQLKQIIGCKSIRELQNMIADERSRGAIICSGSGKGYWKPKDRKEIEKFYRSMASRAKNILLALKSAKDALQIPEGQEELFGNGEQFHERSVDHGE